MPEEGAPLALLEVAAGQDAVQPAVRVAAEGSDRGIGECFFERQEHPVLHPGDIVLQPRGVPRMASQRPRRTKPMR